MCETWLPLLRRGPGLLLHSRTHLRDFTVEVGDPPVLLPSVPNIGVLSVIHVVTTYRMITAKVPMTPLWSLGMRMFKRQVVNRQLVGLDSLDRQRFV